MFQNFRSMAGFAEIINHFAAVIHSMVESVLQAASTVNNAPDLSAR